MLLRHRRALSGIAASALMLGAATVAVAAIETLFDVGDAAVLYLVAIVVLAVSFGTRAAVGAAVVSFLLYDVLFVAPRFTLVVDDPREWLDLVLFLFVGVAIGQVSAAEAKRRAEAAARAHEAEALFRSSRALATATSVHEALPALLHGLVAATSMTRLWFTVTAGARERTVADSDSKEPTPSSPLLIELARTPGPEPARWVRQHRQRMQGARAAEGVQLYRVRIAAEGTAFGSIWATRPRALGDPAPEETRLLSLVADQLALAYQRERLTADANAAEVARRSEAAQRAVLESVSHDLRTPLAGIRAAAGSLMDPAIDWTAEERREAALAIDSEAQRLDRLVRNLLDLSRIEGGALRPDLEAVDLAAVVEPIVERAKGAGEAGSITVLLPADLPPVHADELYLDVVVRNLMENTSRYARGADVRLEARARADGVVRLRVEDGGPGVPEDARPRLFEKFYRVPGSRDGRGLGIGLSVVKGLVEAMGGTVATSRSSLGGLAVDVDLPTTPAPPVEAVS